ncbi:glycosyltransferase family 90 protein [Botryobasidium botryosum FD-172 SS1]|uniref:Glycosyltransferase family 90 protein n=1 Tax=Botryobasidium botryosum (strain FD-172 SS1) TaxID=930990 RepID=A0A067MKL7_BOTB1|nr:glycosyltransferase family 90 protein [Botryobasidium botryosum FD-172 SS1]
MDELLENNHVPLQPHLYRSDGFLEVNPDGRHPIYDLINRAKEQWEKKLANQSTTLSEAVFEYRRRYKRSPPKGFDIWWQYVVDNNVQLPDEYDQIYKDLEPFWGVRPSELQKARKKRESDPGTYTIGKTATGRSLELLTHALNDQETKSGLGRAREYILLMDDVAQWLPEFRATFTAHDAPNQFYGYDLRQNGIDAAAADDYIDSNLLPDMEHIGWASACAFPSPLRRDPIPPVPSLPSLHAARPKTFIYDHALSMNPCHHPDLVHLIGFLSSHGKGPAPHSKMAPSFAMCSTHLHSDIRTAVPEQFTEDVGEDPAWADKTEDKLVWRGTTTGILVAEDFPWEMSQRFRLVALGHQRAGTYDVLRPAENDTVAVGNPKGVRVGPMNDLFVDVAFTGKPVQCDIMGSACRKAEEGWEFRRPQKWEQANQFKYMMDIDGNGWSARFKRLMSTNSLVFKSTIFPEWYMDRVMPWLHYVPVKVDLTDLYDTLAFFRGDIKGEGSHEEMAEEIARAGKEWSQTFWRKQDMVAYMFRLYLEYARVMSNDRDSMTFRMDLNH